MNHKDCKELCDNLGRTLDYLRWSQAVSLPSFDAKFKASLDEPIKVVLEEYRRNHVLLMELERTCKHRWRRIRSEDGETHIKCDVCQVSDFVPSRDLGNYNIISF